MNREPLLELPPALLRRPVGSDARFVLGIDGGATKTQAAVLDLESGAVHLARGGPSNEDAIGVQTAVGELLGAADTAIERAGIERDQLGSAVIAVAGTDTDTVAEHVRSTHPASWIVINDVVGAWAIATGAGPGVGVISGTGSHVFGVGWDGRAWRAGGWGHLLGDEGSGYWLGLQSIRAALRDRDASGPETALSDAAAAFFGVSSVEALAARVYSKPLTKGGIAAFAVRTAELAQRGDPIARELYRRAAAELAEQIDAVIRETGLATGSAGGEGIFPVGLMGSSFKAGAVFIEPLSIAVKEVAPMARLSVARVAPVAGSLLLAARACGRGEALDPPRLLRLLEDALGRDP